MGFCNKSQVFARKWGGNEFLPGIVIPMTTTTCPDNLTNFSADEIDAAVTLVADALDNAEDIDAAADILAAALDAIAAYNDRHNAA